MANLKVLQKRIKVLAFISKIICVLALVSAVLSLNNGLLRVVALILTTLELLIQLYIRKKCTCKRCGNELRIKDFLKLEDWNCPNGEHKMY